MKKSTKIWLVIATCLLLAVVIIFGGVMTMLKWDFTKLSTVKYETNKHEITEAFNSITIRTNTSDVKILPTEGNKCEIVCIEKANLKHTVTTENGGAWIEAGRPVEQGKEALQWAKIGYLLNDK